MRSQESKRINQTFSIPVEVSQELHIYVKRREMSHFVSEAIRKELETKKQELRKAYSKSNKDGSQLETMKAWEGTLGDGTDKW